MHSAKSDTNNDVKLVRDRLIINGKTYTHTDIIEAPGDKGSNREPPKGDRLRKTSNAVNTELGLSKAPSPHVQKDSGAIPKINFVSQNIYTPLRNLRDLGDDTFGWVCVCGCVGGGGGKVGGGMEGRKKRHPL